MEDSSKEALMEEAPPRYTESPRLPCIPHELRSLLLVVALVVVALVVVNITFLLLGLHLSESHAETVLRMTIHGLDGEGTPQQLAMSKKERTGTFAVRDGLNASATVVFEYSKLLVGYRSWRHRACYITRLDKDNFPGLDAVTESFQRRQDEGVGDKAAPLADRSILGTTINILCSTVPVFWVARLHPGATKPSQGPLLSPPQCPSIKFQVPVARLGWEWEEEEEAAMESSMKQVMLEKEDSGNGCCCPGCCLPCATCCAKCCTKCSWCCAKCCCLPKCCQCPKCPKCPKCPGCAGCASCSGCLKKSLCFVPRLLCSLPRKLLSCGCGRLRCLLIAVVVVVLLVLIIAGALLMRLSIEQRHADTVLRSGVWTGPAWEEDSATFYLDSGDGNAATVIYDYRNLLVSYRPRLHRACLVTRVDRDNIPGLDTVVETFQRRQAEDKISMPLTDRSLLGTTASILCSLLPVYWA
ncbi:pulmonary surfactant-associated protein C [Poecile atricapillus]|uniref:pulmonary surfactant-associated protein C n=1 Tax=Poecile atricapillus TaxID=48891 RepID=UPI0027394635|nr:pulmonary surfactant-associated protein C [Poecile atricapillus]